jgi:PGF-pre-PGF domain-containing protein
VDNQSLLSTSPTSGDDATKTTTSSTFDDGITDPEIGDQNKTSSDETSMTSNTFIITSMNKALSTIDEQDHITTGNTVKYLIETLTDALIAAEPIVSISEHNLGEISYGETIQVTPTPIDTSGFLYVNFTATSNLTDATLTVARLKHKPYTLSENPIQQGKIYRYFDIKLTANNTYLYGEEEFESMRFEFTVEQTWIKQHTIDKHSIVLMRYHEGWSNLSTTLIRENETMLVYQAYTPGLSTFAVVGSQLVEITPSYVNEAPAIPTYLTLGLIVSSTLLLIVLLVKARYIYRDEEHKE